MSGPPIDPLLIQRPSGPPPERDPKPAPRSHRSRRPIALNNRRKTFIAAAALAVLVPLVVLVATRSEERPALQAVIAIDGWAPYWALDDSAGEISRRAGSMREVSPFWFNVTGVTQIETDKNAPEKLTQKFLKNTRDAAVVPSIVDKLPAGEMAAILADPSTRQQHIETIVSFARNGDYDGIDVNYEQFAFADGRDTWEATRPNWVSFVSELAEQLHGDGRTLTVSIPVVYDDEQTSESGYWVYDYGSIVDHVDHIRMMVYDYSVAEPGPIAPLDFVRRSIKGAIEATGRPEKLVLAVPVYGRNWPVSTTGVCPKPDADNEVLIPGKTTVTARSVDDLIERRNAQPIYDPDTAEWSFEYELEITDGKTTCVQKRKVHYVDSEGVRARMDIAIESRLGGISVWALGFDDDDVWDAILVDGTVPKSDR